MSAELEPLGAILAGGLGRRIGGGKAIVHLAGRPLISYPVAAMRQALRDVAVVAKPDTELPELPGVSVWIEPALPRHPLIGIVHALALAEGRPVLVCAADMPFVDVATIRRLAEAAPGSAPAVVASHGGEIEPLLGCYQPEALGVLGDDVVAPLRQIVSAIGPRMVEVAAEPLFNINSPDDLLMAAAMLDYPNVKS